MVADPPWEYQDGWPAWNYGKKRKLLEYPTMTVTEIKAMPVGQLLKNEGYLFLWTTSRYLESGFSVCREWTCVPRQVLTWCKQPNGKGPGGMFSTTTEFIIIGQRICERSHARGRRTLGKRIETSWFEWPRGRHSEKPDAFQDMLMTVCPGPYLELFARRTRLEWTTWGNEVPCLSAQEYLI